jgi:hypothetical protein
MSVPRCIDRETVVEQFNDFTAIDFQLLEETQQESPITSV